MPNASFCTATSVGLRDTTRDVTRGVTACGASSEHGGAVSSHTISGTFGLHATARHGGSGPEMRGGVLGQAERVEFVASRRSLEIVRLGVGRGLLARRFAGVGIRQLREEASGIVKQGGSTRLC